MRKKYLITYTEPGDPEEHYTTLYSDNRFNARMGFHFYHPTATVIEVEEVKQ